MPPKDGEFDNIKELGVEAMSKVAFGQWIAEIHAQVSQHVSGDTGGPAMTMNTIATNLFIGAGTALRKMSMIRTSRIEGRFTDETKEDTLIMLRDQYENCRKMFMFAMINSKSGLVCAASVISTEDSLLTKKELKRQAYFKQALSSEKDFMNFIIS